MKLFIDAEVQQMPEANTTDLDRVNLVLVFHSHSGGDELRIGSVLPEALQTL